MTTLLSATATSMPISASLLVPAPLALGVSAEPCASQRQPRAAIAAGSESCIRLDRWTDGRFAGLVAVRGGSWHYDVGQLAGGGPLRA
jgi:hypothetical protein